MNIALVFLQLCEDMNTTASRLGHKKTVSKTQPVATEDNANTSDIAHSDITAHSDNQESNEDTSIKDTSVVDTTNTTAETSFPRRSLRRQGIGPLEEGMPYYESSRSYKCRISTADDKTDEENEQHLVKNSDYNDSEEEEEGNKDISSDVDTEHNLSSEATMNTSNVTGKCRSFMVKNLLDLKSPQDSIPPVNFSTPTHSAASDRPLIPNGLPPSEPADMSINSNTAQGKQPNPHASLHTSDIIETTNSHASSHVTQELPIISKHQLRQIFQYAVQSTDRMTVSHLEQLHNCLEHAIFRHRMEKNKNMLLKVSVFNSITKCIKCLFCSP